MNLKKEKLSKKHHYLPRYYLQGFTGNDGKFFVYDKHTGKIFSSSPNTTFFEKDLNTVELPSGKNSDLLEHLYTYIENQSWNSFDIIRGSASNIPIKLIDRMNLFLFLLFQYWRLPSNISIVNELSNQFFDEDNVLNYAQLLTANGSTIPREYAEKIINHPAFKKSARLLLPFAPFFKDQSWLENLEGWRFLYSGDQKNWYIVGDNPIITRGENDHDPLKCLKEFIFPVSGKILLISGHDSLNGTLPPEFTIYYCAEIIERSQRFVACQNRDFLEALVNYHHLYVKNAETNIIIKNLFKMLDGKGT
jgi:hypothetical protein